jgi:hypothetical protein
MQWTSLSPKDPLASPDIFFRIPDLLDLVHLIKNNYHEKSKMKAKEVSDEL